MGKVEPALRGVLRLRHRLAAGPQQLSHKRVFAHRETVPVRHAVGVIVGVMDDRQAHPFRSALTAPIVKRRPGPYASP